MQDLAELDVICHFLSRPFVPSQSDSVVLHLCFIVLVSSGKSPNRTSDFNKHEIIQHLRDSDVLVVEVILLTVTDTVLMFVMMSYIPGCGVGIVTVTHPQCDHIH